MTDESAQPRGAEGSPELRQAEHRGAGASIGADGGVRVAHFEPEPQSVPAARRFVVTALGDWECDGLVDDAAICVSELAANAVLHSRSPFDVAVRRMAVGVGIDVIDRLPAELPALVPTHGTAADITRNAATGRGLQIIGTLAERWGFTTTQADKAVWVELTGHGGGADQQPVAVLGHRMELPDDPITLDLRSLPVRPAVASGLQVDDLVRSLQLAHARRTDDAQRLQVLLDASAPVRLAGRYAALRAAGAGEQRYDLVVHASRESLDAVGELSVLLERLAGPQITPDVAAFRTWLRDETRRQLRGEQPQPCTVL